MNDRVGAEPLDMAPDLDAVPLINAARTSAIRVPEDLAIIGYDNSPMAGARPDIC
ncbi:MULTISPECIES: substrate-binding domain-containing protein [unclassified Rhizobium]|uniref:substrate-binding domain-containing protein n=1 Tax=unclassified Rhizobium TaxID=2613769 RepID=UPI000AA41134|nr:MULTISPECIES: substrate-binding domain-containing protein [unclassified Rhizobium]